MGLLGILCIVLFVVKKRMDNNEPVAGWKRKQFLAEQQGIPGQQPIESSVKKSVNKKKKEDQTLKDLIGVKDIRYGVFHKARNEYSVIISTDSVNFDLLNQSERASIILGYQALYRVINFPVQIIDQAVRQDLRKEIRRFEGNLSNLNTQTRDYNEKVIKYIKDTSEKDFRIARRTYYVVSYVYEPSKMAKLTAEQKEQRIIQQLGQQALIVMKMLNRANIKSEILDSLSAIEVLKRALNRDRMLIHPIENIIEEGKEKITTYITGDPTTFPGFEELVQDVEEARLFVQEQIQEEKQESAI